MDPVPPDPPDPPDRSSSPMELSPPLFSQAPTKRRADPAEAAEPAKRATTDTPSTPSASQPVYTHPSLVIAPKAYSDQDKGPFIVHVSRIENDPKSPTFIQPIRFGRFLVNNKISDVILDGVKKVARNKISVEFSSSSAANNFINNDLLPLHKYTASIPTYNVTRIGLIKGIPPDWSMEELAENLTVPIGCGILLKARRLNRKQVVDNKATWIPTQSVVVTFKGQVLPERVFCCHTSIPVETYQLPTIQCMNCCRFGHVKAQCRSQPRCFRCAQSHSAEGCNVQEDKASCINCSGPHFALNKSCPEHSRQKSIKITMSQDNVSYQQASSLFPAVRRSYADIAMTPPTLNSSPAQTPQRSSQSSQLPLQQSPSSYRKTISRPPPRPRAPLGKTYDRQAHQAIVGDCASSLPNGCALNSNLSSIPDDHDSLMELILSLIIRIVSGQSGRIPPNVAQKLTQFSNLSLSSSTDNDNGSSVELPKH
ncbi:hypothetical protein ABMA27_003600 [Loxostege sticticalis]|uniref:Gag-like protein n=1 Tax=Loxostege sticticalis TaxID=481309 RepID=A0ABR3HPM6_LOXSC